VRSVLKREGSFWDMENFLVGNDGYYGALASSCPAPATPLTDQPVDAAQIRVAPRTALVLK
jgi:hypothetical protein